MLGRLWFPSMNHVTAELTDRLLDAAVQLCELLADLDSTRAYSRLAELMRHDTTPHFSSWWAHGGPLIEREAINLIASTTFDGIDRLPLWSASVRPYGHYISRSLPLHPGEGKTGPTPLVAAMRAYISFKMGVSVELPDVSYLK